MTDSRSATVTFQQMAPEDFSRLAPLLVDLHTDEQRHYDHPRQSRAEIEAQVEAGLQPRFTGENIVFAASAAERVVGFCWCVLFDPGNGLEGEVAELFVDPAWRGSGLAGRLVEQAVAMFRDRGVTFAQVWTRADNEQAVRAYRRAGFQDTEQVVLTWLPLEED